MSHQFWILLGLAVLGVLLVIYLRYGVRLKVDQLGDYGRTYLQHLTADYNSLPPSALDEESNTKIRDLLSRPPDTWGEVFALELWLLGVYPEEKLRRKAWLIRARYEVMAGSTYERYLRSHPPDFDGESGAVGKAAPGPTEILRADLQVVLQDLFWLYRIRTAWEEKRGAIARRIGDALLGIAALLGLCALFLILCPETAGRYHGIQILVEVGLIGASGGLVSLLRRTQAATTETNRLNNLIQAQYGEEGVWLLSSVSGAVFALVLLLIFVSGLLKGGAFPECDAGVDLLTSLGGLAAHGDKIAKLFIWSFIAGFAEQFVPDFLDRLVGSAAKK